jgi:NADP-dependent 3-hydroxy acid dehydrogenase YdfG
LTIARGLLANGAKVYITGRREESLEQAAAQTVGLIPYVRSRMLIAQLLSNYPLNSLRMDVRDKESISHSMSILEKEEGKLDILINK